MLALMGCSGLLGLEGLTYDRSIGQAGGGEEASGGETATSAATAGGSDAGPGSVGGSGAPTSGGGGVGGTRAGGVGGVNRPRSCAAPLAGYGGVAGQASESSPVPSIFESVRIVTPDRVCGGALMTNGWVLTASSCVDWQRSPGDVCVEYGGAVGRFSQVELATELVRHPDNYQVGDTEVRGRDAMLVKLEHPMVVDGKASGFHRAYYMWPTQFLPDVLAQGRFAPVRCVGWSLSPQYDATPTLLRQIEFTIAEVWPDVFSNGMSLGDQVWFVNQNSTDPGQGWIQTRVDLGSGCFVGTGTTWQRVSIHSANPAFTRTGETNDYREAWSLGLGEPSARQFLERTLFDTEDVDGFESGSAISLAAQSPDTLGTYWVGSAGSLLRRTGRTGAWSSPSFDLGRPPNATLELEAPGVVVLPSGKTSVWARDTTGQLWTRQGTDATWNDWSLVTSPPLASSVSAIAWGEDVIHLFARAPDLALLHAQVDAAWDGTWDDFGQSHGFYLVSAPVATVRRSGTFEVFGRDAQSCLSHLFYVDGSYGYDCRVHTVDSAPAAASWGASRIDLL
jgi:hypothetical protein